MKNLINEIKYYFLFWIKILIILIRCALSTLSIFISLIISALLIPFLPYWFDNKWAYKILSFIWTKATSIMPKEIL